MKRIGEHDVQVLSEIKHNPALNTIFIRMEAPGAKTKFCGSAFFQKLKWPTY